MARKNPNFTKLFKGYRAGVTPKLRLNLRFLEKQSVLTNLQHKIVKDRREKCDKTNSSEEFRNRLDRLLEKPVEYAKVDYLGNKIEKEEKPSAEDKPAHIGVKEDEKSDSNG